MLQAPVLPDMCMASIARTYKHELQAFLLACGHATDRRGYWVGKRACETPIKPFMGGR